jgi:thioredoxin reductase (NADPH)
VSDTGESPKAAAPAPAGGRKPVILAVDDEPQVLNAVALDLRRRFRGDYRILTAASGAEALDATRKLRQRGDLVALFLVDQRMPSMSGTEFLAEARKIHPDAKKVLLTAYADTEAAIASINQVALDHYLMKPWHPPEQKLYPVIEELLEAWSRVVRVPWDGIRVVGTLWSSGSHEAKDFLARNRIPYRWLDLDRDAEARALAESVPDDARKLPLLFFPDGSVLSAPQRREIAEKVGLRTQAAEKFYDLVVIGGGPAGLAAAVYGASEGLKTVLVEREATGGQAGTSSRIENYLGFPSGLTGADLAERATAQARRFGAELLAAQEVAALRVGDPYRTVVLADGSEISCYAVVVAPGVSVRTLDVPGAEQVTGAGLYYGAALTEAAHYRDCDVVVIGGANSAGQGAMFFSHYARRVTMLVRGKSLAESMSHYLVAQIAATPNIEVVTDTEVLEVKGSDRLEGLVVRTGDGAPRDMPASAVFVFIGARPRTEFCDGVLARDPGGFILTGLDLIADGRAPAGWPPGRLPALLETSVPGIFAAGDVRHSSSKRVAAAVGEGAVAVQLIHQYLKTV